jgi:hypothetical protein
MRPPARAIVGNLVWSADGGVWAVWRVMPLAHGYASTAHKLATHARLRGLLLGLPSESMLLSVCERLDAWDVVADMAEGVDLDTRPAWGEVCEATADWLASARLFRRRFYVAAALPRAGRSSQWRSVLADAAGDIAAAFGLPPAPVSLVELAARQRQAEVIEARVRPHVTAERVSAGELRWLYARALRRELDEPALDETWEPNRDGSSGVSAHLTDAVVKEGGYRDDPDRPRHRRYVRIDSSAGTSYQTVLAVADMPHEFTFPGGGGEWLFHADDLPFPVEWAVRARSVANAEAQLKVRRQHRQLVGQVDEYDGEVTGAPPSLGEAIAAVDDERAELAANPSEPELQVTLLLSVAATSLAELEDRAAAVAAVFEPHDYGLGRPTGGQAALVRSMLPGTAAASVCRDYTQFLLPRDLAAGAPFCGPELGDPRGALLGLCLDSGVASPVLLDPAYGPSVGRTASLAAVGALGSGKSFFLKRLCWDTIARGGQVVTIDRSAIGEYVAFAETVPGHAQVVRLAADGDVCLDPLRTFAGEDRVTVTLGFLSLLAGCSAQSEEGAALAEVVHAIATRPSAVLGDVVDELRRLGERSDRPDPAARSLARRLDHYRRLGTGQLAFGAGQPVSLDADLVVFWAPNLTLPDRDTLLNEHLARQMLPEEILGNALIYLVAAVGRKAVFQDPSRFGAALYDEAWALYASPHGQRLLLEGVRDGRKHNGAIWLATQHPNDLGAGELVDLLGSRLVFSQAQGAIPAALRFLGVADSTEAANVLDRRLRPGQCLLRDARDRIGLIEITEPVFRELRTAFDTTPGAKPPMAAPPSVTPAASADVTSIVADLATEQLHRAGTARRQARSRRRTPLATALNSPDRP